MRWHRLVIFACCTALLVVSWALGGTTSAPYILGFASEGPSPLPQKQLLDDHPSVEAPSGHPAPASGVQSDEDGLQMAPIQHADNSAWRSKLYTPTFIDFILGHWFIVDCWHHRVLYSRDLGRPIAEWIDLDLNSLPRAAVRSHQAMRIPHSIATDGTILVVESSVGGSGGSNHSVLVYRPVKVIGRSVADVGSEVRFVFTQEVLATMGNAARRPHRVVFDAATAAFYVYLTSPPTLTQFVRARGTFLLRRAWTHHLPFMRGMYARSIAIREGVLYITSGPGAVWSANVSGVTEQVPVRPIRAFSTKPLGFAKGKMNDLFFHEGWWYATATVPCSIVRFRALEEMGRHERLAPTLGMCATIPRREERCQSGTPYFLSAAAGRVFVPYIFGCSGIISFALSPDGAVGDVQHHWGGGWVEKSDDVAVRGSEW